MSGKKAGAEAGRNELSPNHLVWWFRRGTFRLELNSQFISFNTFKDQQHVQHYPPSNTAALQPLGYQQNDLARTQTQPKTARAIELHKCSLNNATKTLPTAIPSAQEILKSSINCNQSRFGSPHQDNPFQGFIRGSRKTKAAYRYEARTKKTGQHATSRTASKSYLSSFGNFRGLFTHVVEVVDNPREYAINRWTDREEEIERLPENQGEILKRLQAVERRQEVHSSMAYCVASGVVLATALVILVAFAASNIRDERKSRRGPTSEVEQKTS
ncbi:hypothetical protein CSIM01_04619 [Colletotrichum simmondsii]|uniref:Uncharacterized protein n=1 Tax=Colletotrichum simmondsii TaxID=703756 RepID=A0A135SGR2_9PEZI|nr:hypothetical protein CSIM01_04619 [Colletotrichum simmondsii]